MSTKKIVFVIVAAVLLLGVVSVLAAPPSGAIFTTTPDGGIVNENVRYDLKREVYLDGGPEHARRTILTLFEENLSLLSPDAQQKDPKTRLQELLQARGLPLPEYSVLEVSGSPHEQRFTVECRLEDPQLCMKGSGGSRRKAEQAAASLLVEQLTGVRSGTPSP